MKIEVKNIKRNSDDNAKLKGVATIILNDSIVLDDLKIIVTENTSFVTMPTIKKESGEYWDLAHPTDVLIRDHINEAVFAAYAGKEIKMDQTEEFHVTNVNITLVEHPRLKAVATILLNDIFAIHNIYIVENEAMNGEKNYGIVFPSYVVNGQTKEIVKVCNEKLGKEILKQIMEAYYQKR